MAKLFNLKEANALLLTLKPLLEVAMEEQCRIFRVETEIETLEILLADSPGECRQTGTEHKQALEQYGGLLKQRNQWVERIQATGVIVKCLHQGIIDFPAFHHGRFILFCWHGGEPEIQYWHECVAENAARKPIQLLKE